MKTFDPDQFGERLVRKLAGYTSRRSLLSRLGLALVAAPGFPVLPVNNARAAAGKDRGMGERSHFTINAQTTDDTKCNYWRHCAVDGSLCSCCGGGPHTCPPGAIPSTTSWIGTCINPDDNKAYLIAYRDCCGRPSCGRCNCSHNTERETQLYVPQTNSDIVWCFGLSNMEYHCSTAALVGLAQ